MTNEQTFQSFQDDVWETVYQHIPSEKDRIKF